MEEHLFLEIKKSIEDFIYEEEGNITRNKVIAMGTMMLILSLMMYDEVFAAHRSHSSHSSHASHSSGSGGGIHGSHESHVSHSSHVSSSGHSSHGSHSNSTYSNHAASKSATTAAPKVVKPKVPDVKLDDVSNILTPNANEVSDIGNTVNAAISAPQEIQE